MSSMRRLAIYAMIWEAKHLAWQQGFHDAFRGVDDRQVENFHEYYERGYLIGLFERRHLERTGQWKKENSNAD